MNQYHTDALLDTYRSYLITARRLLLSTSTFTRTWFRNLKQRKPPICNSIKNIQFIKIKFNSNLLLIVYEYFIWNIDKTYAFEFFLTSNHSSKTSLRL